MLTRRVNPTALLYLGMVALFGFTLGASFVWRGELPVLAWVGVFCCQALIIFVAFTPMHEAAHGIASRNRRVNQWILWGCLPFFLADPTLFKLLHVTHHANTNREGLDPDHFTSAPTLAGRWINSFLLISHYYAFAWKNFKKQDPGVYYRSFPSAFLPLFLAILGAMTGNLTWMLAAWVLPALFSIGLLSFVNTAWPHDTDSDPARMKNTRLHLLPPWAQALMCNQNFHLVHHLQPTLPWWRYPEVWEANREKWLAQGAALHDYR